MQQRKAVQIYLRVKGPRDPTLQPEFKILANDTKIRFKQNGEREEQEIAAQFAGQGIYNYQKIFKEDSHQEDIFDRVARDIVESSLQGFNGTVFAYGQTGSGKTFTMTGGENSMGIIPRAIDYLYRESEVREEDISIKLRYMQIYKSKGFDLLHPQAKKFKRLEDLPQVRPIMKGDSFDFQNLSELDAPNFEEAMKIFQYGQTNRIVCKTPNNDQSSRSHCILMLIVKTKNKQTGLQQRAVINLVDLAGSERIHNSGMDEKLAAEGITINLGLHFLSRVIISLGNKTNNDYIPYRDSLLTMALKSSLGGNCKTRMIATINPNPRNTPENIATCKFSQNLLAMENKVKKNQFIDPWVIIKSLKKEVEDLKAELGLLKDGQVKQILQRDDILQIRKLVQEYLQSQDPHSSLPLTDRLYINEYLSYMKSIITKGKKRGKDDAEDMMGSQNICEGHIVEIKKLRTLVQQKENQINLLLSIINQKKSSNSYEQMDDDEGRYLALEEVSEKKIAETVVNSLLKDAKRKPINISVQQVQKHLIKPIQLNQQENIEQAFKKFKDSHMKTETIEETDSQIKLKEMKKDVLMKKLKNMKYQRARLNQKIESEKKCMGSKNLENLPSLLNQTKEADIKSMKQELSQMDEHIRKKYKELKSLQLQISRLGLGKNKDNERVKVQFDTYIEHRSRRNSQKIEAQQSIMEENEESEISDSKVCFQKQVQQQLNDFMMAKKELRRAK